MKKKYVLFVALIFVLCILACCLAGCTKREYPYLSLSIEKLDKSKYDIDDVTVEYHFGCADSLMLYGSLPIGLAVCCGSYGSILNFSHITTVDAEQNPFYTPASMIPEGVYLIDFIPADRILYGPYDIEELYGRDVHDDTPFYYHFKTKWTIPKELFNRDSGTLSFCLRYVVLNEDHTYEFYDKARGTSPYIESVTYYYSEMGKISLLKGVVY